MRYLILGAVVWCIIGATTGTAAADDALMAPIQKFIDSFNKGDMEGAAATHAAGSDLTIIDEVPPYIWRGPQALRAWSTALGSEAEKQGLTDQAVSISAPIREETSGDHAYVVVPSVYTYKARGMSMREAAQMVVVLQRGADGWLIHGWSWVGPKPELAAPAK